MVRVWGCMCEVWGCVCVNNEFEDVGCARVCGMCWGVSGEESRSLCIFVCCGINFGFCI